MKQFGYQTSEEEVTAMIRNIDQDNNGTIELD
jgi:Ca2+-binding EF-hand superfamily protein